MIKAETIRGKLRSRKDRNHNKKEIALRDKLTHKYKGI